MSPCLMISLMVMRYSQFSGARPMHWVKAGEVRGCDRTAVSFIALSRSGGLTRLGPDDAAEPEMAR